LKRNFNFIQARAWKHYFSSAKFTKKAPHALNFANFGGNPRFSDGTGGQKAARFERLPRNRRRLAHADPHFALPFRRVLPPACARPKWHG
jgi:hypothetical protein